MNKNDIFTGLRVRLDGDGDLIVTDHWVNGQKYVVTLCPKPIYDQILGLKYKPKANGGKSDHAQLYGREPVSIDRLTRFES